MAGPARRGKTRDLRRCCQSYRQTALVSARRGAVGKTPPIIVPCHRIIGSDRSLTGLRRTRYQIRLLELEGHSIN